MRPPARDYPIIISVFLFLFLVVSPTLAQSSTLTTLPPATPTGSGNTSDPCAFSDLDSLLDRVQQDLQGYNISLLVATCPQVCPLVFGVENPDISGIGAMISYLIQAIAVTIFGPVLTIVSAWYNLQFHNSLPVHLADRDPENGRPHFRLLRMLRNLSQSVYQCSIFSSLSVVIASWIRTMQDAPIAELEFIRNLCVYEVLLTVGILFYQFLERDLPIKELRAMGSYTLVIYSSAASQISLYFLNLNWLEQDKITWFCQYERDFPLIEISFATHYAPHTLMFEFERTVLVLTALVLVVVYLAVGFLPIGVKKRFFRNFLRRGFVHACGWFRVRPKLMLSIIYRLFGGITVLLLWCFVGLLFVQRSELQRVAGPGDEDASWGFGQVTAILLWTPLLHTLVMETIEFCNPEPETRRPEPGIILADLNPNAPQPAEHEGEHAALVSNAAPSTSGDMPEPTLGQSSLAGEPLPQALPQAQPSNLVDEHAQPTPPPATVIATRSGTNTASSSQGPAVGAFRRLSGQDSHADLRHRLTWPRNETGTYLPTRTTSAEEHLGK